LDGRLLAHLRPDQRERERSDERERDDEREAGVSSLHAVS
jgi:hypothetical protein